MRAERRRTPLPRVAFQGEHGAYSDDAIARHWRGAAVAVPARTCADVARAVAACETEFGLLPIENTLAGGVVSSYDALAGAPDVAAVGEVVLPIHHCLLAPPGATLEGLRTVESHPVALAQCRAFLDRHPHLEPRAAYDTAGAARAAAERGDVRAGAIAGRAAAGRFGLAILAHDVEDRPDNQTRFLVLAPRAAALGAAALPDGLPARTTLLAVTDNVPGALLRLLAPLAAAGLNVSRLESRPGASPWTSRFFLDVDHLSGDGDAGAALDAVRSAARSLRVVGTFLRAAVAPDHPAPGPARDATARATTVARTARVAGAA